jgi:Uma2 family endonuclease
MQRMNVAATRRAVMTEAEFLRLPESMRRVELLDGEVVMAPPPTYWHQEMLRRLIVALSTWAATEKRAVTVGQSPLDVRFGPGRILQPDAFVLFGRLAAGHRGPINRIPALCVEVLSEDRVHDRVTKRLLYQRPASRRCGLSTPKVLSSAGSAGGSRPARQ